MLCLISLEWIFSSIFLLLYMVTILGLCVVIIAENRNPLKTIPWVVAVLLAPGIGLLFYLFFGQDNRKQRIISRRTYKRIMKRPHTERILQDACNLPPEYQSLATLLRNNNRASLLYGSRLEVFTEGKAKFEALLRDLRGARRYIHIEYYIFCDDRVGGAVRDVLVAKAREGVKVRLLYDDVGCWNVPNSFFREMRDAGVEVYPFLRVAFPSFTSKVNYRNHRKIVVIDGVIGYVGGMNVADRYEDGFSWGIWRDTHFRVEGKGVHGLQAAFLVDWYAVSKQFLNSRQYYPKVEVLDDTVLQVVTSGPVGPWRNLLQGIIRTVTNARQYVYIQTPYFLPTEGLNQAMQIAALGGTDIRLMLPLHSDTRATHLASRSFIDDMLRAGVKVYFYRPGFLHSKLVVCDDYVTCIGSANMDFRSFEHNFEVNCFVYQAAFARQMKKLFMRDLQGCDRVMPEAWKKRPMKQKFCESFMRLFSPLL